MKNLSLQHRPGGSSSLRDKHNGKSGGCKHWPSSCPWPAVVSDNKTVTWQSHDLTGWEASLDEGEFGEGSLEEDLLAVCVCVRGRGGGGVVLQHSMLCVCIPP